MVSLFNRANKKCDVTLGYSTRLWVEEVVTGKVADCKTHEDFPGAHLKLNRYEHARSSFPGTNCNGHRLGTESHHAIYHMRFHIIVL